MIAIPVVHKHYKTSYLLLPTSYLFNNFQFAVYRLSSTFFQSRAFMRAYSSSVMGRMVPCLKL